MRRFSDKTDSRQDGSTCATVVPELAHTPCTNGIER